MQREHGFTEAEFNVMKQWSGWAHTLRVGRRKDAAPKAAAESGRGADRASPLCKKRRPDDDAAIGGSICGASGDDIVADVEEAQATSGGTSAEDSHDINFNDKGGDTRKSPLAHGDLNKQGDEYDEGEEEEEEDGQQHAVPAMPSGTPRPAGLSFAEMARIGKMVKRVIDQGRVEYLVSLQLGNTAGVDGSSSGGSSSESKGGSGAYRWRQVQYCDPSLSPECFAIIGGRPNPM
jgi:hypothetical protein